MGNFNPKLPTRHTGTNKYITFFVTRDRSPTGADYRQPETGTLYSVGTVWQVGKSPTTGTEGDLWMLSKIVANVGYWIQISSGVTPTGAVLTLSDTAGTLVYPTVAGNIQIEGTAGQITVTSVPGSNKLTLSLPGAGGAVDSFAVPHGTTPVVPDATGLITITEGSGIIVTGGLNTYSIALNGAVVGQTITGTTGGALSPTAGNWNILGASTAAGTTPVSTSGAVSTLTINVQKSQAIAATDATKVGLCNFDSAKFAVDANGFVTLAGTGAIVTLTGNTGGALSPTAGNFNILGTGSITVAGAVSTLTVQLTGMTNHYVPVGAGTATLTMVAPNATSGIPFISQGASADPTYGTAVVAGGGTGNTTFTAYSVICAGTTATGAFQNVSGLGTSGQILTSNGAGALPTWQSAGATAVVQEVRATSTSAVSTTQTLASTGTTPTTGNTDAIISATITPTSASNILKFQFDTPYSAAVDGVVSFCLFEGSTFRAGFPRWQNGSASGRDDTMNIIYYRTSGTTSSTTFTIRWGNSAGTTCRTLQNGSGTAFYNAAGNSATSLIITEMIP